MPLGSFIAPYGAYAGQPEPEASTVRDFCPLVANANGPAQWSVPAPCGHPRCAATSFAPPPPSGAGLLPNCAQPEPVLSTLAEFGASDAGAAAAPAGFERPQTSLNGCQLHSGNRLFSETVPLIELGATTPSLERAAEAPWNTLSAQHLLQNAAQMVQSLSGAVEALLTARKPVRPAIKLTAPTYRGYGDLTSARDFLDSLAHYQQAMGLDDEEILTRIVPVTLTETAARWYRLSGHRAANLGEFRAAFLREFLPADYERRMRRELELRTQAPEESLQEFVRAMDELFAIAEPHASSEERVERVIRQAHPTFSAYLRGGRFRDLEELAVEAKRIQGDILAARAYRPPPPASESLEPRCAWNGPLPLPRRHETADPSAARLSSGSNEGWGLSERALDPYTYARRAASAVPAQQRAGNCGPFGRGTRNNGPTGLVPPRSPSNAAPFSQPSLPGRSVPEGVGAGRNARSEPPSGLVPWRPREGGAARNQARGGVRCFRCRAVGHMVRECPVEASLAGNADGGRL
ncbi:uncharacterized protein LOC144175671 [Haemaphysalis longicornis]